jgi:hypothetical protein
MNETSIVYTQSMEYMTQIFIPVMVWLLGILILFILLLRKYTLGKWTPENPNPYKKQTLGMPGGIFRGVITMTLLFVVILFEAVNIKDPGFEARADMLLVSFQMMIAFYFGSKVMHHVTAVDGKKTQTVVQAQVEGERLKSGPSANLGGAPGGNTGGGSQSSGPEEESFG